MALPHLLPESGRGGMYFTRVLYTFTVSRYLPKNPGANNGEGWGFATAPQPARYKHIDVIQKEVVAREGCLRQVFRPNPAPLRAVGFG